MNDEYIKALNSYKKVAERELNKALDKENKRIERIKNKSKEMLEQYPSFRDIDEAYGAGAITEKKRDKLYDFLNSIGEGDEETKSQYDWLIKFYRDDIREIEKELLLIESKEK